MPRYEFTYSPGGVASRSGLETSVEANSYRASGRFIDFIRDEEIILKVAAAHVLQVRLTKVDK